MRLQSNYDVSVAMPTSGQPTGQHTSIHEDDETRSEVNAITSGGSYIKDIVFEDKLNQIQNGTLQLQNDSLARDNVLVRCKKAIETLTAEIENQKRMNKDLQGQTE